jgi:dolichol-phosphate mannosyltransferase
VYDGSTDGTAERLAALAAEDARVRVVPHAARAGQSAATVSGVLAARALVATLDGDGQNESADVPHLLAALRAWEARGRASGHRRRRHDSFLKRASSRVANGVRARVLGDATPDTGCGLKLFRRDAFLAVPRFDHMHRFLPALFRRDGWDVRSVEVSHRSRRGGRSHYGMFNRLWVGIVDLAGVWWLARRAVRPANQDEGRGTGDGGPLSALRPGPPSPASRTRPRDRAGSTTCCIGTSCVPPTSTVRLYAAAAIPGDAQPAAANA